MASKRRVKRGRICRGKKDYEEVPHAEWDARHISIRDRCEVDVFRCPNCDGIHVGHAPKDSVGNVVVARFRRGERVES